MAPGGHALTGGSRLTLPPLHAPWIPLGVWVVVVSLWFWAVGRGLATTGGRETIRVGLTTGPSQLNTGTVWLAWTSPWSVEEHQTMRLAERATVGLRLGIPDVLT